MDVGYMPVPVGAGPALYLPLFSAVRAGFASPAEDYLLCTIDLNKELVKHQQSTFYVRIRGRSMEEFRIFDDDVVVVDRAVRPQHEHLVIAHIDGEFTCKQLLLDGGRLRLHAGNPDYPDIIPTEHQTVEIWGVVRGTVRKFLP